MGLFFTSSMSWVGAFQMPIKTFQFFWSSAALTAGSVHRLLGLSVLLLSHGFSNVKMFFSIVMASRTCADR